MLLVVPVAERDQLVLLMVHLLSQVVDVLLPFVALFLVEVSVLFGLLKLFLQSI